MKLEYLALIIVAVGFYNYSIKDAIREKKNRDFILENLDLGSKVKTKSGIVGEVIEIDGEIVVVVTGNRENLNYLTIQKSDIEYIITN